MEKCMVKTMFWVAIVAIMVSVVGQFFPSTGSEKSMITFVGVLATFVVVGNYAQMVDIRDQTKREIDRIKRETDRQVSEMEKQLGEVNNELKEMKNISSKITSSLIVDINRVINALSRATSEGEIVGLIDGFRVYADTNDPDIRTKILEGLQCIVGKASKSEQIAQEVMDIAFSFTPMGDKQNESLGSVAEIGYDIIEFSLECDKPKVGLYGFEMVKYVSKITKDYEEAKSDLKHLKTKFHKEIKQKYLDALIKELDHPVMGLPAFEGELYRYVYGEENN